MKIFNKILFGAAAIALSASFSSCSEEATLSGADAVYITISPSNASMLAGDTLRLTARVENASGKEIVTPVTWSVDDESIVKLQEITVYKNVKNPNYVDPSEAGSPEIGDEGEGDQTETTQSRAEGDEPADDSVEDPGVNTTDEYLKEPKETYLGIVAQQGAQGKSTVIRATLENGMYAITTVTIGRNSVSGGVKAVKEEMMSYNDILNDTCWFEVSPIRLVDDYDVTYKFDYIERVTEAEDPAESDFIPNPNTPIFVDRDKSRVGVVFTAPRIAGKATCTLTIGDENVSASASTTIFLFPQLTSGLEYESGGKIVRPGPGVETPSNVKPRMTTVFLDINTERLIGVCIGVRTQRPVDIANAMAAESAGYFTWEIDGSSVIVEEQFFDEDYQNSGYVSYLKVKSGARPGLSRCIFTIPGECIDSDTEPQEFICDVKVEDFNVKYPVDSISIKDTADEDGGTTYKEGDLIQSYIGLPLDLYISTNPSGSFSYHIPEVTSSDPTILRVEPRGATDGYRRSFTSLKPGTVTVTVKALDAVQTIRVKVNDRVNRLSWNEKGTLPEKLIKGVEVNAILDVYMNSNVSVPANYTDNIVWSVSDHSIVSVVVDPNDSRRAAVIGLAVGSATIRAEVPGEYTIVQDVVVEEVSGEEYNDSNIISPEFGLNPDDPSVHSIGFTLADDSQMYFDYPYVSANVYEGEFSGNDGVVSIYPPGGSTIIPNCSYSLTIVFNGTNYIANGWFETPSGIRYTLNNLTLPQPQ